MNLGMLWFDNDKVSVAERVKKAARYYQDRYGAAPNVCYINPKMENPGTVGEVEIKVTKSVLPNHFWIGVDSRE